MFEIEMYCSTIPYYQFPKNTQVKEFVLSGGQLQTPDDCPVGYLDLMRTCFSCFRPTFGQLFQGFEREEKKLIEETVSSGSSKFLFPKIEESENLCTLGELVSLDEDLYYVVVKVVYE